MSDICIDFITVRWLHGSTREGLREKKSHRWGVCVATLFMTSCKSRWISHVGFIIKIWNWFSALWQLLSIDVRNPYGSGDCYDWSEWQHIFLSKHENVSSCHWWGRIALTRFFLSRKHFFPMLRLNNFNKIGTIPGLTFLRITTGILYGLAVYLDSSLLISLRIQPTRD